MTSSDLPNLSKLAKPDPRKEPKCKPFYASDIPELESHNRLLVWTGLTAHEILERKVIDKHGFWLFKWEDGNVSYIEALSDKPYWVRATLSRTDLKRGTLLFHDGVTSDYETTVEWGSIESLLEACFAYYVSPTLFWKEVFDNHVPWSMRNWYETTAANAIALAMSTPKLEGDLEEQRYHVLSSYSGFNFACVRLMNALILQNKPLVDCSNKSKEEWEQILTEMAKLEVVLPFDLPVVSMLDYKIESDSDEQLDPKEFFGSEKHTKVPHYISTTLNFRAFQYGDFDHFSRFQGKKTEKVAMAICLKAGTRVIPVFQIGTSGELYECEVMVAPGQNMHIWGNLSTFLTTCMGKGVDQGLAEDLDIVNVDISP